MWNNIVEKNPDEWITSPGCGSFNPPVTLTVDTSIDAENVNTNGTN